MKFDKLTEYQVDRFIEKLQAGLVWSNNLVGRQTFRYEDGRFVSEFQDIREPEYGPYVSYYTIDEFRERLRKELFPDFVHLSLTQLLDQ